MTEKDCAFLFASEEAANDAKEEIDKIPGTRFHVSIKKGARKWILRVSLSDVQKDQVRIICEKHGGLLRRFVWNWLDWS